MDQENLSLVSVTLIQNIPYLGKIGDIVEIPYYQAQNWIRCGSAQLIAEIPTIDPETGDK
jgi:hypothetical protein